MAAPDKFVAIDYTGATIHVGDFVDIYYCRVVGFRTDEHNRLNVLVVPGLHKIKSNDPNDPLTGQEDLKAIPVSGYNCIAYPAAPPQDGAGKVAQVDAYAAAIAADVPPAVNLIPSNFLAPSLE